VASRASEEDFYVDDYLSGAESVQEADQTRKELCSLLATAAMTFRKWRSSSSEFLQTVPPNLTEAENLLIAPSDKPLKTLKLHWNVSSDQLSVAVPPIPINVKSMKVYDLLGFFSPVTITGKILLRTLWQSKLGWDTPIKDNLADTWTSWTSQLEIIGNYNIPRRYSLRDDIIQKTLHGFADASQEAYGAVVYVKSTHSDSTATVSIVIAKTRVVPLKGLTIPRAELTAAHLISKLLNYLSRLLHIDDICAWSDSSIVLCWLTKSSGSLKTFVSNRVQNIHELTPKAQWRHFPTSQNPADLLSRGISAQDIINSKLWWEGPPWIKEQPSLWPTPQFRAPDQIPEVKVAILTVYIETEGKSWE